MKRRMKLYCQILCLLFLALSYEVLGAEARFGEADVKTLRLLAASDAGADVNKDMTGLTPFFIGMGSAFAGGMFGLMTGCTLHGLYPETSDVVSVGAFIILGASSFFPALMWHYNHPRHPPIERLIGKPPEYIRAYATAYGKKMRSKQLIAGAGGAAVGCGLIATWMSAFLYSYGP